MLMNDQACSRTIRKRASTSNELKPQRSAPKSDWMCAHQLQRQGRRSGAAQSCSVRSVCVCLPRIGNEIRLKLCQIRVERSVVAQTGCCGRHHLGHDAIQIQIARSLDLQLSATDVPHGLVVQHEVHVNILQKGVSGEHGIVRFNDATAHGRAGKNAPRQLRFLALFIAASNG